MVMHYAHFYKRHLNARERAQAYRIIKARLAARPVPITI
jgi:hypothetical protein